MSVGVLLNNSLVYMMAGTRLRDVFQFLAHRYRSRIRIIFGGGPRVFRRGVWAKRGRWEGLTELSVTCSTCILLYLAGAAKSIREQT